MTPDEKVKKILKENPDIWKTESAYFSYLRGCIRLGWSKNPVKLKLLKRVKKQIPNPNYGKPRNTKKTVMGATCEICKGDFPMKQLDVDHIGGGNYTLRKISDLQKFFEDVCLVTEDDLRIVCKDCHGCLSYAAKQGISFDQAKIEKEIIAICKDKKLVVDTILQSGLDLPKYLKDQKLLVESIIRKKYAK